MLQDHNQRTIQKALINTTEWRAYSMRRGAMCMTDTCQLVRDASRTTTQGDPRLYVCQAPNAFICVSSSVSILGPFWVHFGSILGPFWVHSGSILGPFWVHFGSILGPLWVHCGSIVGPFWVHFGSILGPFIQTRIGIWTRISV